MKKQKQHYLIIWFVSVLIFYLAAFLIVRISGSETTLIIETRSDAPAEAVSIDITPPIVECTEKTMENGTLTLKLHALQKGKSYLEAGIDGTENVWLHVIYVHASGAITVDAYLGKGTMSTCFMYASMLSVALALFLCIRYFRISMRESMYQHRCCGQLGLILFLSVLLLDHLLSIGQHLSLGDSLRSLVSSGSGFSYLMLPTAFLMSVLITLSNIVLLKREGFTWRNMLGAMLGVFVCFSTFLPMFLYDAADNSGMVELHRENSVSRYVMEFVEWAILACLSYLECILAGMIILGIRAAKHIPAFNKDYILILGCKVGSDGRPTKLLQSRIDRAVEFAKMQKEKTGKELIFVPSGGKGADEVVSEAECMKQYLLSCGIPESRILPEDKSGSTAQNIRYSCELIAAQKPDAEIALSTTNYHVFRAGALAYAQGRHIEGIGAKTKSYFSLNAFVREFIAVLYERKRMHVTLLAGIVTAVAAVTIILYRAAQF